MHWTQFQHFRNDMALPTSLRTNHVYIQVRNLTCLEIVLAISFTFSDCNNNLSLAKFDTLYSLNNAKLTHLSDNGKDGYPFIVTIKMVNMNILTLLQ